MAHETKLTTQTEALRAAARRLLEEGTVSRVLGYRQGRAPYHVSPFFADTPEQCDELVLSPFAEQNLTKYLRDQDGRIAVVVKGCDARAINQLLAEHQLQRESLYILGVPCSGLVDPHKLRRRVDLSRVREVRLEGETVIVTTEEGEQRFPAAELLEDGCLLCTYPNPLVADEMLGEPVEPRNPEGRDEELERLEAMTPEERMEYFRRAFARCIRCYACVKGCPLCYCTTCFAQQNRPQFLPRTVGPDENQMFQLGRAMHLAGRCVQCGGCDRACPLRLPLRLLNAKMAREVQEAFAHVAGLDPDREPPLAVFESQDRDIGEKH